MEIAEEEVVEKVKVIIIIKGIKKIERFNRQKSKWPEKKEEKRR